MEEIKFKEVKTLDLGGKASFKEVKTLDLGGKLRISRFNQLEEDFEKGGNSIRVETQSGWKLKNFNIQSVRGRL